MQALFWTSLLLLFYTYLGYGVLLLLVTAFYKRTLVPNAPYLPPVTVVVPAYNEEAVIEEKIKNSLALTYPSDKIRFVFVTDGSTDATPAIVKQHPIVTLLHQPLRQGKTAALNRAMTIVQTPFVVFTDANTFLHTDSLQKMMRHY
ncbi:glycosyltransferase, partial [Xanthomonas citri pv. citri]